MNNSKKARIRQDKMRDMLLTKELISVQEFCEQLNASQATIRNDLTYLEQQNVLKRVLGGAISTEGTPRNSNFHLRSSLYIEEKKKIAAYAVKHWIKPNCTLTLDAGTTCRCIAQELLMQKIPCSVVTNSFAAASILEKSEYIRLYLIGGSYDREHASFHDLTAIQMISSLYSDIYFLSPNGIDLKGQVTSSATEEHAIKKAFLQQSQKIIIAADHSKFCKTALKVLCPLTDIDTVLTDDGLDNDILRQYRQAGIPLIAC
ncbi:MAG: DeoR/GlpR transcriptional regulator [Erysipelotrichaceae bacterium]|jgi:DeoR/GlpR family transcriptional regulator of sugar metabolism|nr:DeoR/GlpR transcriptional regulator [Erysipelotrichaceae bacterium]